MPLGPRFRRVAALERVFVDRESVLGAFEAELSRDQTGPRILNLTGVGGIGKTRLLRELVRRAREIGRRTAILDLQVPAIRQHESALAVLRSQLGKQDVRFHRFDIAYAVLWQRLHPHLRLTSADLPFISESETLSQILDGAAGVPLFGTAVGLIKLASKASESWRRRRTTDGDDILRQLDELDNSELVDVTTYLFAEDLRQADDQRYAVFVDAYEALVPSRSATGGLVQADLWLRDLLLQLDQGLVVVAGREPLDWLRHHAEWADIITVCAVDGLPVPARIELLSQVGVADETQQRAIAEASAGLPFYLQLAADTAASGQPSAAVSPEEILSRFVTHVAPQEVRMLELLSVPRLFDQDIFKLLGSEFNVPAHQLAWESLTAYSFVYPAGDDALRLHQLMKTMLVRRLSHAVRRDVHALMRRIWALRAEDSRGMAAAQALREAVYHGIRAGQTTGEDVLDCADRAIRLGGTQAADGVLTDLQEFLTDGDSGARGDLTMAAQCLAAEVGVRLGDVERVIELVPRADGPLDGVIGARTAMAAAHGQRIAGRTTSAGKIYGAVWAQHAGVVRNVAGMWMADIHMWQGRFQPAFDLARRVLEQCSPDDLMLRGDVARLLHLGYRFHLDFEAAEQALVEAGQYYEPAQAVVGLANLATNQVELLAWTDPAKAIGAVGPALEAQRELGALHELGKTYTALAIAQTRLERYEAATSSFAIACDYLDRARYRSGRARAELFRGFLYARTGLVERAVASICWAVTEFGAAEVYPTLVSMAEQTLELLGISNPEVSEAAVGARSDIQPLDSLEALQARSLKFVKNLLGERS